MVAVRNKLNLAACFVCSWFAACRSGGAASHVPTPSQLVLAQFSADVQLLRGEEIARRVHSTSSEDTAFVYIVHGPVLGSQLFSASLETLARVGAWDGAVVVVTDNPSCFESLHRPHASKGNLNVHVVHTERRDVSHDHNIEAKLDKSRIFSHVDAAGLKNVRLVVYLDEDVVIGGPVQKYLDFINERQDNSKSGHFFQDWFYPELQSGLFAFERGPVAEQCLAQWGEEMMNGWTRLRRIHRPTSTKTVIDDTMEESLDLHGIDQQALGRTSCAKEGLVENLGMDQELYSYPNDTFLEAGLSATFMHFCNTGLMVGHHAGPHWREAIQNYFRGLGFEDPWMVEQCPEEG